MTDKGKAGCGCAVRALTSIFGSTSVQYTVIKSLSEIPAASATWFADGAVLGVWRSKMKKVRAAASVILSASRPKPLPTACSAAATAAFVHSASRPLPPGPLLPLLSLRISPHSWAAKWAVGEVVRVVSPGCCRRTTAAEPSSCPKLTLAGFPVAGFPVALQSARRVCAYSSWCFVSECSSDASSRPERTAHRWEAAQCTAHSARGGALGVPPTVLGALLFVAVPRGLAVNGVRVLEDEARQATEALRDLGKPALALDLLLWLCCSASCRLRRCARRPADATAGGLALGWLRVASHRRSRHTGGVRETCRH